MRSVGFAAGLLFAASACGGPSLPTLPTQAAMEPPSNPAGTVLTVLSAETFLPVAGASVVIGSASSTTSPQGETSLNERQPINTPLLITASGYLDRDTLLRSPSETRFTLWPRTTGSGLSEQLTAELVYTAGAFCCPPSTPAELPLRRMRPGPVSLSLAPSYQGNPTTESLVRTAAAIVNVANEGRIVFEFVPAPVPGRPAVAINSSAGVCGATAFACFASSRDAAGYTTSGTIVFFDAGSLTGSVSTRFLTGVLVHELGHALGLQHESAKGMMNVVDDRSTWFDYFTAFQDFSPAEKLVMNLASQRRAGNRFPDNDRSVTTTGAAGQEVISCSFRAEVSEVGVSP